MKKLFIIILFPLTLVLGFFLGKNYPQDNQPLFKIKAMRTSQNGLTNPLLEYEISSEFYSKILRIFRGDVQKVADQKIQNNEADEVALYFRALNNGPWFGIKEDVNFFPASLLKVPLMITYFKWAEENPDILQKEIEYSEEVFKLLGNYNNLQYYQSENPIETGQTYTVQELIERMIINSDNNAKNLLIINLDRLERLNQFYADLGIATPPELRGEGDVLSVHEYATFFRILYNASYLSKEDSQKALELLTQTKFNQGLVTKLPQDLTIAHKFGEYEDKNNQFKQLHDCGIVYYPSYPYLLCIMTRGKDFASLEKVIQDLSLAVYQEVSKQIEKGED